MARAYILMGEIEKAKACPWKNQRILKATFDEENSDFANNYYILATAYLESNAYDSAAYFYQQAVKAVSHGFDSDELADNPSPEQATGLSQLMECLYEKAKALKHMGKKKEALAAYAQAIACSKKAMFKATLEKDKLALVETAHPIHTEAALLHFMQSKGKVKPWREN